MAIDRLEGSEVLALEDMPEESERRPVAASPVLANLREIWDAYKTDSKRRWARLVDEQAKNPTLD